MALEVNPDGYVVETAVVAPGTLSLDDLLGNLPNFSLISGAMKQEALNGALVPDAVGVWPYQPGYVATYDVYWAALGLIGFLQAQPFVKQSSSEGTSVSVDAPNWAGLTAYYRSMSRIALATKETVLGTVAIPNTHHVYRTDMSGRSNGYDNVDTDLS